VVFHSFIQKIYKMAQIFSALIYGVNGQSSAMQTWGFPSQGVIVRPAPANQVMFGVTMVSVIQMLPAGTKVGENQYSSPTAVATIITAANA
jgi:hypothetical protein